MTFTNVLIPKGTNALFVNCKFIGVTFVETTTDTSDASYNYAGTQEADGSQRFAGSTAVSGGTTYTDTKPISNNLRFDQCTFEGNVVSDVPSNFTQFRNKISFTGNTQFNIESSTNLTTAQKDLFQRSALLLPQYSVDMGPFTDATDPTQTVHLTGTIVAGIIDIRGRANIDGSILTTYQPVSNVAPVIGATSPQFNVTLGYFAVGERRSGGGAAGLGAGRDSDSL